MGPGSALALLACPGRRGWVRIQFHSHSSSPGLTGRSSIPETAVLEPRSRGVLDPPHARGMTVSMWRLRRHFKHSFAFSRHDLPEVCWNGLSLIKKREQGMPGARCTRGLVCKVVRRMPTRAYRFSGGNPAFPAQWVTAYFVLSPVTGFLATVIWRIFDPQDLAPAPGRQDHTTSPSA